MKKFNCLCCGDCCSGNMDIKLNLYDLYKIGCHLKLKNTEELFKNKIVKLSNGQNGIEIPQIVFKTSPYAFCPFLINDIDKHLNLKGYCSLHPYKKPLVCILAPTSKEYDTITTEENYKFTKPTENCPGALEGADISLATLLSPVKDEIKYENIFFSILENILSENISDYIEKLYYFDLSISFKEVLKSKTKLFLSSKNKSL